MLWIDLALIFGWISIGGAALYLLQIRQGFSRLESAMGCLCGAGLLFIFPILTNSIYLSGEEMSLNKPGDKIIVLSEDSSVKLSEEQLRKNWQRFEEEKSSTEPMTFKDWKTKSGARVALWSDFTEDQQKMLIREETGNPDGENIGISAIIALFLMLIFCSIIQFSKFAWPVPYCVTAPIIWIIYFCQ